MQSTDNNEEGKITLRPLSRGDLPRVVGWFNDPEVCEGLGRKPGLTLEEETRWFEEMIQDHSRLVFAVDNIEGVHVGNIALNRIGEDRAAMVSLAFGQEHWGRGYARDAMKGVLRYGKEKIGLVEVYATIYPFNERSVAFFEKMGFKKNEERKEEHEYGGRKWNLSVLSFDLSRL
ncbi:MAG: GNAT family N-acetyltransferase [Thermoplasmata archaeon]|nr:GNAT family N-acetyltransferase [Thermoplasmata archaeon]